MDISAALINWYKSHKRDLPWRNTTNPYPIWLSEIILQQTRVQQGLPYFQKFLAAYPTIKDLSKASETAVLTLWQGLGYYSRGRNMLKTAQQISQEYDGKFPESYLELLKLKGVGEYTAAAIASFAFKEKVAVVDGNVYRVLARYFNIQAPIDGNSGKKEFKELANAILSNNVVNHNQAIMELGALICKPKRYECANCPLNTGCLALKNNTINQLPVKMGKTKTRNRYFNYLVFEFNEQSLLKERLEKDIWQGLYDFPLYEAEQQEINADIVSEQAKLLFPEAKLVEYKIVKKHQLSHQSIWATFWHFTIANPTSEQKLTAFNLFENNPFPTPVLITNYLNSLAKRH